MNKDIEALPEITEFPIKPWVIGTIIYIFIVLFTIAFRICEFIALSLSELGDFLAGAFGPIAFLWLVLGYFQQKTELKQNNRAILLQVKELNESVEQQTKLVEAESLKIKLHNQRDLLLIKPIIYPSIASRRLSFSSEYIRKLDTKISNFGEAAINFHFEYYKSDGDKITTAPIIIAKNDHISHEFAFELKDLKTPRDKIITLRYEDLKGNKIITEVHLELSLQERTFWRAKIKNTTTNYIEEYQSII